MRWWVKQITAGNSSAGELSLVFEDSTDVKPPTDRPQSHVFRGVGWAAMHSHLSQPDVDAFLVFKSSPYGSVSHSHAGSERLLCYEGWNSVGGSLRTLWIRGRDAASPGMDAVSGGYLRDVHRRRSVRGFTSRRGEQHELEGMNPSLVSCIVPVFNGERYLAEALDSIRHQTYRSL